MKNAGSRRVQFSLIRAIFAVSVSKAPTVSFPPRVASIATGWSDPVAGWELHPLKINPYTVYGSRNDMSQNCVKKSVTIPADHGTSLTLANLVDVINELCSCQPRTP